MPVNITYMFFGKGIRLSLPKEVSKDEEDLKVIQGRLVDFYVFSQKFRNSFTEIILQRALNIWYKSIYV